MEDHKLSLYDNIAKVNAVDPELYERYPVKRGLRNAAPVCALFLVR